MKILIVEDDQKRIIQFKNNIQKLSNCYDNYARNVEQAIEYLEKNNDYDYIYLDHDLDLVQMQWSQGNCGMDVVDWIITTDYGDKEKVNIVIHSYNLVRGKQMQKKLDQAGYAVVCIPGAWKLIG